MSDGCREENRMTCSGCPKLVECGRISESFKGLLKMKGHFPKEYRKMMSKSKGRRKSAARAKVKR